MPDCQLSNYEPIIYAVLGTLFVLSEAIGLIDSVPGNGVADMVVKTIAATLTRGRRLRPSDADAASGDAEEGAASRAPLLPPPV